jgi:predicted MFS family arabinose efflux permease
VVLARTLDTTYPEAIRRDITTISVARLSGHALYRYIGPFIAVVARGLDVSVTEIGVALTVTGATGLTAPLIGRAVDRLPRRTAITGGLAGAAFGGFVCAASTGIVWFTVGLVLILLWGMALVVGAGAWIADHVPFERRSKVVGLTEMAWALGLLLGVSVMGLVTAVSSWRWGYVAGSVAAVFAAAATWKRMGADQPAMRRRERSPDAAALVDAVARLPLSGWLAVLGAVGLVSASESLFVTFGAWLKDDFDVSSATLAAATFGLGAIELTAAAVSSARTDRWGKERSVIGGAFMMGASAVALVLLNDWALPGMIAVALFIGCFEFAIVSTIPIAGDLVPGRPARGLSLMMSSSTIGRGMTTIPTTWLYDRHGIAASATLAIGWTIFAATMMTARLRRLRRFGPQPR